MKLEKSRIKKILVISLSNIGDVILTFPVIDILKENFAQSALSVVVGPKAEGLFLNNPYISKVYIFNKRQPLMDMIRWIGELRKEQFDLVVDLRNTAIPFLIGAAYTTPLELGKAQQIHMTQKHLNRLKKAFDYPSESQKNFSLFLNNSDKSHVDALLSSHVQLNDKCIIVSPGAANHLKRWHEEGFTTVCDELIEKHKAKIIFVGDATDKLIAERIQKQMRHQSLNLCAKTTLTQLAGLLQHSALVVTNDSGIMHMASYLGLPIAAIFGPSDPVKYGPWSKNSKIIKSTILCKACHDPNNRARIHECMRSLTPKEVLSAINSLL